MSERMVQVPECAAVNDGMEGVRCHGDAGHDELHWADVSGDGDVTEWGDNDELWDEIERLRALLSQPTPTAKACTCPPPATHLGEGPDQDCPKHGDRFHVTLPRIADMALGAAFTARLLHSAEDRRWMVTAHGLASSDGSAGVDPRWIDPSTIRDVQPPEET